MLEALKNIWDITVEIISNPGAYINTIGYILLLYGALGSMLFRLLGFKTGKIAGACILIYLLINLFC